LVVETADANGGKQTSSMDKETLGILINSTEHADFAVRLAEAAVKAGKRVRLYVLGLGIEMIVDGVFSHLRKQVQIHVCESGTRDFMRSKRDKLPDGVSMVSTETLFASLNHCHRHVVF
jgi:hypothetical protein